MDKCIPEYFFHPQQQWLFYVRSSECMLSLNSDVFWSMLWAIRFSCFFTYSQTWWKELDFHVKFNWTRSSCNKSCLYLLRHRGHPNHKLQFFYQKKDEKLCRKHVSVNFGKAFNYFLGIWVCTDANNLYLPL